MRTIDDIVGELDEILEWARDAGSRLGYFPALYRQVTVAVRDSISRGEFDDSERMARLDVVFADRYLAAFRAYREQRPSTRSWRVAFRAAENRDLLILQHLLMGMNAHINLDLGIAAAEVCADSDIQPLRADFERINEILASLLDDVQERLGRLSPWLGLLDRIGARHDEGFAEFSLEAARRFAWKQAQDLWRADPDARSTRIALLDAEVALLANLLEGKGPLSRTAMWIVRRRESKDVRRNLDVLSG